MQKPPEKERLSVRLSVCPRLSARPPVCPSDCLPPLGSGPSSPPRPNDVMNRAAFTAAAAASSGRRSLSFFSLERDKIARRVTTTRQHAPRTTPLARFFILLLAGGEDTQGERGVDLLACLRHFYSSSLPYVPFASPAATQGRKEGQVLNKDATDCLGSICLSSPDRDVAKRRNALPRHATPPRHAICSGLPPKDP